MGGIGSAIAIQSGSFTQKADGTYTGTIIAQPDRGFNVYVCHPLDPYVSLMLDYSIEMALSITKHASISSISLSPRTTVSLT